MHPATARITVASLLAVAAGALVGWWLWPREPAHGIDYKMPGNPQPKIHAAQAAAIERRERVVAQSIWAKEMEAQAHGRVVEDFWDAINAASNKLEVARTKAVGYEGFIDAIQRDGWRLTQVEFRHLAFGARSRFYFSAHLTNAVSAGRAAAEGDVFVDWGTNRAIAKIDASAVKVKIREGEAPFKLSLVEAFENPLNGSSIDPLIVRDLNGDGLPEVILPAANRVYWRENGRYARKEFCSPPLREILSGLIADFDGDGLDDFLYANFEGVFLMSGFRGPGVAACQRFDEFLGPRAMTCGDIDLDGDLDLFIGQYKGPFVGGTMPTPYYDANDGYPSYLLLNQGNGRFVEADAGTKSRRRIYAASFVDLDGDSDLDLLTVSDFAGADVYRNDGKGQFENVTAAWLGEWHAFGMGHVFADFNNDGLLDFLMTGMTSATADRLEDMKLQRPLSRFDPSMRSRMAFGNRLYLGRSARDKSPFLEARAGPSVTRTGWSWGVAAADFDNDGWTDLCVANGMESLRTVRDYESEFWLHDIFVAGSTNNSAAETYFVVKGEATRGKGQSFGGFDKNRLLLNRGGTNFEEMAHLMGVALEEDCRNLVAEDLNGDGRADLVMTSLKGRAEVPNKIYVFENQLPAGNWISVQAGIGARVIVNAGGAKMARAIVTGDSFRSQHPPLARFGLGTATRVESVEIIWPGGAVARLAGPEINRTHRVEPGR